MYIEFATQHRKGKTYFKHLLRTSFRENGKMKDNKTIANLSICSDDEIKAILLAVTTQFGFSASATIMVTNKP